jgi:hypothetical protein
MKNIIKISIAFVFLTVLCAAACAGEQVETHQVGEYVFVTSIDGVKGIRGDKAWYYEINGRHADKLAFVRVLNKNESTRWIYKKDVCSPKVDAEK